MSIAVILLQQLIIMVLLMAAGYLMFKGKEDFPWKVPATWPISWSTSVPRHHQGFSGGADYPGHHRPSDQRCRRRPVTLGAAMWISGSFQEGRCGKFRQRLLQRGVFRRSADYRMHQRRSHLLRGGLHRLPEPAAVDLRGGSSDRRKGQAFLQESHYRSLYDRDPDRPVFYFSGITMPHILLQCVNFLAGCNTPIAMFTIGIYLAQTSAAAMFKRKCSTACPRFG